MKELKTIRRLDVITNLTSKNSIRSIKELRNILKKRNQELDVIEETLLDLDLVPVNASRTIRIIDQSDEDWKSEKGFKVKRESKDDVKVHIKKSDRNAVEKSYRVLRELERAKADSAKLISILTTHYSDHPDYKAAIKEAKALADRAAKKAEKAEVVIRKIAREGYLDNHFKKFMNQTMRRVLDYFDGAYDKSKRDLFVNFYTNHLEIKSYLTFSNLYNENDSYHDYTIMISTIIGGDQHRSKWIRVGGKNFPSHGEDLGAKVKTVKDAYLKIIHLMSLDNIKEFDYFPEIDIKKSSFKDFANVIEIDENRAYIMFRLKPNLTLSQQYDAANALKDIIIYNLVDKDYNHEHDIHFELKKIKRSTWVEFVPVLKDHFRLDSNVLDWLGRHYKLTTKQKNAIKQIILQGEQTVI